MYIVVILNLLQYFDITAHFVFLICTLIAQVIYKVCFVFSYILNSLQINLSAKRLWKIESLKIIYHVLYVLLTVQITVESVFSSETKLLCLYLKHAHS